MLKTPGKGAIGGKVVWPSSVMFNADRYPRAISVPVKGVTVIPAFQPNPMPDISRAAMCGDVCDGARARLILPLTLVTRKPTAALTISLILYPTIGFPSKEAASARTD